MITTDNTNWHRKISNDNHDDFKSSEYDVLLFVSLNIIIKIY